MYSPLCLQDCRAINHAMKKTKTKFKGDILANSQTENIPLEVFEST